MRSLVSSGGCLKECFEADEGFSGESQSGFCRRVQCRWRVFVGVFSSGLISYLRETAFLLFSSASALAFGGGCSVPAVDCLTAAERGGENISFLCGVVSFGGGNFISDF